MELETLLPLLTLLLVICWIYTVYGSSWLRELAMVSPLVNVANMVLDKHGLGRYIAKSQFKHRTHIEREKLHYKPSDNKTNVVDNTFQTHQGFQHTRCSRRLRLLTWTPQAIYGGLVQPQLELKTNKLISDHSYFSYSKHISKCQVENIGSHIMEADG